MEHTAEDSDESAPHSSRDLGSSVDEGSEDDSTQADADATVATAATAATAVDGDDDESDAAHGSTLQEQANEMQAKAKEARKVAMSMEHTAEDSDESAPHSSRDLGSSVDEGSEDDSPQADADATVATAATAATAVDGDDDES